MGAAVWLHGRLLWPRVPKSQSGTFNTFNPFQQCGIEPHFACAEVSISSFGASDVFETHSNDARFVDVQNENAFLTCSVAKRQ